MTPQHHVHPILLVSDSVDKTNIVVMELSTENLKTVFRRALSTWPEIPPDVLALSDKIEAL